MYVSVCFTYDISQSNGNTIITYWKVIDLARWLTFNRLVLLEPLTSFIKTWFTIIILCMHVNEKCFESSPTDLLTELLKSNLLLLCNFQKSVPFDIMPPVTHSTPNIHNNMAVCYDISQSNDDTIITILKNNWRGKMTDFLTDLQLNTISYSILYIILWSAQWYVKSAIITILLIF